MLSVLDNPKTTRKKKSLSATTSGVSGNRVPRSSQIKFASSVKHKDGNNALGNSVVHTKPQIQVHAASEDSSPKLTPIRSYNKGSSNQAGLKTMKSNNSLRRVKSNDSSRISQSSKNRVAAPPVEALCLCSRVNQRNALNRPHLNVNPD